MHKYNAKKTVVDGITFDSKKEAKWYEYYKQLKEAGEIKDLTLQPTYMLQEGYKRGKRTVRPIIYKADFLITDNYDNQFIIDCKGVRTEVYKIKKKLFEYKYPDLEIQEV